MKYMLLKDARKIRRVAVQDIVCCEAQKKQQYVYMADGTRLIQHETMTRLYEKLSGCPGFVKVGAAWLVNLEHVESLSTREIELDSGRKIYLPRGAYQALREQYFDYYCEEWRNLP